MTDWKDLTIEKPTNAGYVLVAFYSGEVAIDCYFPDCGFEDFPNEGITHWAPLPKGPEKKSDLHKALETLKKLGTIGTTIEEAAMHHGLLELVKKIIDKLEELDV